MSGRFFTLPIFIAVWLVYAMMPSSLRAIVHYVNHSRSIFRLLIAQLSIITACCVLLLSQDDLLVIDWENCQHCLPYGIANERSWYYDREFSIPEVVKNPPFLRTNPHPPVVEDKVIGFSGYAVGPEFFLLDLWALCDPLLARLPVPNTKSWRIGHFERAIPTPFVGAAFEIGCSFELFG